jgi:hypothetical protein
VSLQVLPRKLPSELYPLRAARLDDGLLRGCNDYCRGSGDSQFRGGLWRLRYNGNDHRLLCPVDHFHGSDTNGGNSHHPHQPKDRKDPNCCDWIAGGFYRGQDIHFNLLMDITPCQMATETYGAPWVRRAIFSGTVKGLLIGRAFFTHVAGKSFPGDNRFPDFARIFRFFPFRALKRQSECLRPHVAVLIYATSAGMSP